jgi:hypothetical protein
MNRSDIESGAVRICRGYIASATKSGISFGDETGTRKALQALQDIVSREAKEDDRNILSTREFVRHHGRPMPQDALTKEELLQRLGYKL